MGVAPAVGYVLLGVAVGVFGTLVGAGGGFVLTPVLLLLFPDDPPITITATSLAVVFANALSGSISYFRMHRADYHSGVILAVATLPGSVLGVLVDAYLPRHAFNLIMGAALILVAAFLILKPEGRFSLGSGGPFTVESRLKDSEGVQYRYRFNLGLAALFSVGIGFVSSLLGIGGGIIHVPVLTSLFAFPTHVATATSHFVLMIMSAVGTGTHVVHGDFQDPALVLRTVLLAVGVIVGAPIGARISRRVQGKLIIRLLAGALALVGGRLLLTAVI
ncbi:MAG: sulfite exporter TauE/SafE family protein [Candidatus Nephthysia bennettiae]|uniref:Probable membrane transporter protein n=1 Tax=Candidatus Nephthysia bennettiae TaxID=3127016 RepID=A0A934JZH2_9BACT|nr:sulfite exporter TauE/SafE family protein [Candidatus Dormibacteraeota bacterium]MBJ7613630.1 sulfite exporter TauE/SafE family protein [Candidatus Dormibacteraeota bacterium]PZS00159.1 MAG: sulfite exporter TauE/SafE family protein [Candidatus Dormibacteraeota bacterium]